MATAFSRQLDPFLKTGDQPVYQGIGFIDGDSSYEPSHHSSGGARRDHEERKTVLSRFIRPWKLLIHLAALAATAGVLQLSFRNVYWFDAGSWSHKWYFLMLGQDEVMNGLQFAAKLHEILIIGSLTAIVMHFVRLRLVGRGLPFGLLTAGYQAGSVEFLFSKSMRASARRSWRDFFFVLALALVIIFANMIGPSSAIAILPNLDWWPLSNPFDGSPLTSYLVITKSDLYPLHMIPSFDDQNYEVCASSNYSLGVICPNSGFDTLLLWAVAYANENSGANVSMSEPLSGTRRQLLSQNVSTSSNGVATGDPGVAVATTLHQSVIMMTGLFWDYVKGHDIGKINNIIRPSIAPSDDSPVSAPLVQVQCKFFDYYDALSHTASAADGVTFPTGELNNFSSAFYPNNSGWPVDQSLYNFSRPVNITNFTWVDLVDYDKSTSPPQGASLGALVTLPYLLDLENATATNSIPSSMIIPCTVDARWAATQLLYDPTNNDLMESNITIPANFSLTDIVTSLSKEDYGNQQAMWGISDAIKINATWADMFDVPGILTTDDSNEVSNTTMMQALFQQFIVDRAFNGSSTVLQNGETYRQFQPPFFDGNVTSLGASTAVTAQTIISMVLAEGLSRSIYDQAAPATVLNNDPHNITLDIIAIQAGGSLTDSEQPNFNATLLAQWPSFNFTVQRYGYGYGWNESRTVQFGLTVLMIYAAVALVYLAYSMWFVGLRRPMRGKKGWSSGAWAEASEMLALALVTPAPGPRDVLGDVGAGVEKGATWKKTVRVDEGTEGRLELVVDEHRPNEKGEERRGRQVVVGKKYS